MPGFYPNKTVLPTILSGQSLSQAVLTQGKLTSIQMPSGWDAAVISFQGSPDGVTYTDMYDYTGNEITVAAAANEMVTLDRVESAAFMKFRSGTGASPVNQTANRTLIVQRRSDPIPSRW